MRRVSYRIRQFSVKLSEPEREVGQRVAENHDVSDAMQRAMRAVRTGEWCWTWRGSWVLERGQVAKRSSVSAGGLPSFFSLLLVCPRNGEHVVRHPNRGIYPLGRLSVRGCQFGCLLQLQHGLSLSGRGPRPSVLPSKLHSTSHPSQTQLDLHTHSLPTLSAAVLPSLSTAPTPDVVAT